MTSNKHLPFDSNQRHMVSYFVMHRNEYHRKHSPPFTYVDKIFEMCVSHTTLNIQFSSINIYCQT